MTIIYFLKLLKIHNFKDVIENQNVIENSISKRIVYKNYNSICLKQYD